MTKENLITQNLSIVRNADGHQLNALAVERKINVKNTKGGELNNGETYA